MSPLVHATYDGKVIRPDEPIALPANTRVVITIDKEMPSAEQTSFFRVASSLAIKGPSDWSEKVDDYLYGETR